MSADGVKEGHPNLRLPQVAILVPVYRNAATLRELAAQIEGALDRSYPDYRIVFVVDASPDESWQIVLELARRDRRISGILLARNGGQHRALMAGLRQIQASCVVVMDADLQDPPALLPAMIEACARQAVAIFALRDGRYQSMGRMITSRAFKYLLGRWIDLPANAGAYFVVPGSVAERMRSAPVKQVQLVVMARLFSPAWGSVRYVRKVRDGGKSAYSSWGRISSALATLACVKECRRWIESSRTGAAGNREDSDVPIAQRVNI